MAKEKFEISIEYNFRIIAIASSLKDYRVSYFINKALKIDLIKEWDLIVDSKTKSQRHIFGFSVDEQNINREFYLVSNKKLGNFFLSSLKNFDYLLIIKSEFEIEDTNEILNNLKISNHFQIIHLVDKLSKRDIKFVENNLIYFKNLDKPDEDSNQ